MINIIWVLLLIIGIITAAINGRIDIVTKSALDSSKDAISFVIGLAGFLALWSGLMKIAERSGLTSRISKLLQPLIKRLFPEIPSNDKAISAIALAMSANLLGLGNAATPLGLKAMEEMQRLNTEKDTASDSMCTFLAITTSSITLIPATVIALRAQAGSLNPTEIVGTTIAATAVSTITAIIVDRLIRQPPPFIGNNPFNGKPGRKKRSPFNGIPERKGNKS